MRTGSGRTSSFGFCQIKRGSSGEDNLPVQLNFLRFNAYIQICCAYNCGSVTHFLTCAFSLQ